MKILLVIPTLNEGENIYKLINKIIKLDIKLTILFIDDDSKDLTRKKILFLKKKYKFINYIFRSKRFGIGSAHKEGFTWAYKRKFNICITMDADLTHNPSFIKKMLKIINSKKYSVVTTSRFILEEALKSWPMYRKLLTKTRYYLVMFLLRTKLDSSGAFRTYDLNKIKKKHLMLADTNSYFFLIESLFYLEKMGYQIFEIGTILPFRIYGSSKMRIQDIFMSFFNLIKLKLKFIIS